LLAQGLHDAEDLVVGLALRQTGWQAHVDEGRLEEELAAGILVAGVVEREAIGHVGRLAEREAGCERVEVTADLARIAGHF